MSAILKPRCCARVYGSGYHSSQCSKTGKIERDGKYYCGTHDPVAVKAKNEKWQADFHLKIDAKNKARDEVQAKQKELERRAECFDDLLAALEYVMSASGEQLSDAFEKAQKAIEKATGAPK